MFNLHVFVISKIYSLTSYEVMMTSHFECHVMNYLVRLNYLVLPDEKRKLNNRGYYGTKGSSINDVTQKERKFRPPPPYHTTITLSGSPSPLDVTLFAQITPPPGCRCETNPNDLFISISCIKAMSTYKWNFSQLFKKTRRRIRVI